ncbi:MAG: putative quinol monooxygenase [Hyphomicrobiaceae bacterium]
MVYLNVVLTVKAEADISFVRSTMTELGRLARKDAGCIRFEVYHSQSHPNTFFLVEQWEDDASLDAHRKAKPFTETYMKTVVPKLERVPHMCDLLA